jgi:hypothetical protein
MVTDDDARYFSDGPLIRVVHIVRWLYPPWWFWNWFCGRWIGHDCDTQPITCRVEWLFRTPGWLWLDV